MKSRGNFTYDGMEHMTGKASVTTTVDGKTSSAQSLTKYRWKSAACTSTDVNLKAKKPR